MPDRPKFLVTRDRLGPRLAELARMLEDPKNVERVKQELERLARG